jgi:hypothetical protein
MSRVRRVVGMMLVAVAALTQMQPSLAQASWEPLDGVSQMVSWFAKLNEQIDKVVETEKRGQLVRAVDRLRKELYALEANTVILRDSVPEGLPSAEERQYLQQLADELLQVVVRLSKSVRDVGAELRLNDAEQIESALTYGLRTRAQVLTEFQQALAQSEQGKWHPSVVRRRLDVGIQAVKAAQLAATKFRRDLDAKK